MPPQCGALLALTSNCTSHADELLLVNVTCCGAPRLAMVVAENVTASALALRGFGESGSASSAVSIDHPVSTFEKWRLKSLHAGQKLVDAISTPPLVGVSGGRCAGV